MAHFSDEQRWFNFFDLLGGHASARFTTIDVRPREAWQAKHFVDSENVPLAELRSSRSTRKRLRGRDLVVIGENRSESEEAASLLNHRGRAPVHPPGGFADVLARGNWPTVGGESSGDP
jgi:rhodanese-related sulfurtransferase